MVDCLPDIHNSLSLTSSTETKHWVALANILVKSPCGPGSNPSPSQWVTVGLNNLISLVLISSFVG